MRKTPLVKSGFRTMRRYKLRTFFMMLGIVVGITSLTVIFSIGKGTEKKMMDSIKTMFNASTIFVRAGGGQMMGHRTGPANTLTLDDIAALKNEIANIEAWDPSQMTSRDVKYRDRGADMRIFGRSSDAELVWNRGVIAGDFFTEEDDRQAARVALIGTAAAEQLFDDDDPIGKQIRIGNAPFRVKGVLAPMGMDPHGMSRDDEIWLPIKTVMRRVMNVDYITSAKLIMKNQEEVETTSEQISAILRERHHLAADELDDFMIITMVQVEEMVANANKVFNTYLPLIAGIALLIGAVVVANLMLITVNERTGEIGLRKAVGARSTDILLQFLMESTAVTVVGGIVGIILGTLGVQALAPILDIPNVFSGKAMLVGLVSSILVGVAAGVFPARRAAALEPVATLR